MGPAEHPRTSWPQPAAGSSRPSRLAVHLRIITCAAVAAVVILASCGPGSSHAGPAAAGRSKGAPGKTVTSSWPPPVPAGPPSTAKFCALLVPEYRHIGGLATITEQDQRIQLVNDYVTFAPSVAAAAPAALQQPAQLYLTSIAQVLHSFAQVGLDPQKVTPSIGSLLSNPQVIAAGNQVIAFSAQNCHYQIQG